MVFKEVLVQLLSKATSIPAHQHALCYVPAGRASYLKGSIPSLAYCSTMSDLCTVPRNRLVNRQEGNIYCFL